MKNLQDTAKNLHFKMADTNDKNEKYNKSTMTSLQDLCTSLTMACLSCEKRQLLKRTAIQLIPIGTALTSILTMILAYIFGVHSGKLEPLPDFVPFISDLGNVQPASSVFTLGIAMSCFFALVLVILMHSYVRDRYGTCELANKVSLVSGLVFVFGKLVVGSFQLSSSKPVHFIGAFLYFFGAAIFGICQSHIAHANAPKCPKQLFLLRAFCTAVMTVSLLIFIIFMFPPLTRHNRNGANVAQAFEWCFAICKMFLMVSFSYEFSGELPELKVKFRDDTLDGIRYKAVNNNDDDTDGNSDNETTAESTK